MLRLKPVIIIFVLALLVWFAGMVVNRRARPLITDQDLQPVPEESAAPKGIQPAPTPAPASAEASRPVPDFLSAPIVAAWDKQRDDILRSSASSAEKAERFLSLLPTLADEEQQEAAKHAINLLDDDHFLSAATYLTNAGVLTNAQSIFMADLLNRPEKVKLPLCLAVARIDGHPHATQAKDLLTLYLPEDFGTNWPAWEAAVETRLTNGP